MFLGVMQVRGEAAEAGADAGRGAVAGGGGGWGERDAARNCPHTTGLTPFFPLPPPPSQLIRPEPDTSMVHVLHTGQVIAVDDTFSDWFGFKASEVVGNNSSMLVSQAKVMDECVGRVGSVGWGGAGGPTPSARGRGLIFE